VWSSAAGVEGGGGEDGVKPGVDDLGDGVGRYQGEVRWMPVARSSVTRIGARSRCDDPSSTQARTINRPVRWVGMSSR
jgi:hypothetical protein